MAVIRHSVALGLVTLFSVCVPGSLATGMSPAVPETPVVSATDLVVRELCGKTVALLGEPPMHGYGRTLQFKVELVRRLIDECHYNAFFIESGIYDFLKIQKNLKSGQPVTQAMVAAAVGGLWASREVEPLIPFLSERAQRGTVVVGGLDDQLARGTYAQQEMPGDLVEYLQGVAKTQCRSILQKHALWQYSDDSPYSSKDKALLLGCLDKIETSLVTTFLRDVPFREYDTAIVESLKRSFARDFDEDMQQGVDSGIQVFNARDHSMYLNFQWLTSRLPSRSKVIVWAATTHLSKELSGVPGQERMVSLGSYIQRQFKGNAFVVGFSAYSGSYGMARQPVRRLSVAPGSSLEGQAIAASDADTRFFSLSQLHRYGAISARPLGSDFKTAKWDRVLDGLVVFREEHPPDFAKH